MGSFVFLERLLREAQDDPSKLLVLYIIAGVCGFLALTSLVVFHKYFKFVLKSMFRNVARTVLAGGAVYLLVLILIPILSVVVFLELVLTEQSKDLKAVITERYQIPSQMPFSYASTLEEGAPRTDHPEDVHVQPENSMTWQFVGGSLDPEKRTRENTLFLFAMDPMKLRSMMDDMKGLDPELEKAMAQKKTGVLLGKEYLKTLNKGPGDRFELTSFNYKGLKFEFEILGQLPEGRYDRSAVMNRDYLNDMLDKYARDNNGQKHPLAQKTLNLVWVRVPDSDAFQRMSGQIMNSTMYTAPSVKCETASSGIATFLEGYKSLFWGVKFLLVPSILIIMSLVIACAISISVRERRTEMAVLKVLGYTPGRIMAFVLGEALFIGGLAGLVAAASVYVPIHCIMKGFAFPIAFFPIFDVFADSLWWGAAIGFITSLVGSFVPAWSARSVKVSEVFSKVG